MLLEPYQEVHWRRDWLVLIERRMISVLATCPDGTRLLLGPMLVPEGQSTAVDRIHFSAYYDIDLHQATTAAPELANKVNSAC
jgi:hypothetical protein